MARHIPGPLYYEQIGATGVPMIFLPDAGSGGREAPRRPAQRQFDRSELTRD
jgi:hypothetical protein